MAFPTVPAALSNTDDLDKEELAALWTFLAAIGLATLSETLGAALAGRPVAVNAAGTGLAQDVPINFGLNAVQGGLIKRPSDFTDAALTINSANQATYAGTFLRANRASAQTLTIASTVADGFFLTWRQVGAGQLGFAGSGLTLVNADSHTKSFGQNGIGGLVVDGSNLVLFGRTAA